MLNQFSRFYYIMWTRLDDGLPIPPGSFHSLDDGKTIAPIIHAETIGKHPSEFPKRSFWHPTFMKELDSEDHDLLQMRGFRKLRYKQQREEQEEEEVKETSEQIDENL